MNEKSSNKDVIYGNTMEFSINPEIANCLKATLQLIQIAKVLHREQEKTEVFLDEAYSNIVCVLKMIECTDSNEQTRTKKMQNEL